MKGDKTALVPKLRFPEFREGTGWEVKPLSALARRQSKRNADQKITRVLTNSAEHGVVDQRDYFEKDIATQGNLDSYFIVALGDYVYNPRVSNTAPVGPIGKNKVGNGVMSPLYTVFRFVSNENSFYEQYFRSSHWHKYLQQISNSGARHDRMAISADAFIGMPLPAPDLAEQQKIADCLTSVDELIAAQAEKVEALKAHKKGLMQQLFPRPERTENGQKIPPETKPRKRFPEFEGAGDWEEDTLVNLATFRRGSFPQPYGLPEWYDDFGGMPFIQVFDVGENFRLKPKTKSMISKLGAEKSVFIPKGTLIVTLQGSIGRVAITHYDAYIDRTLLIFETFRRPIEKLFFARVIQNLFDIEKEIAPGGIIKTITKEVLSDFLVKLPGVLEQNRIADCLSSLDDLIAAQSQKLATLMTHKKGLMQQLFPAPKVGPEVVQA